MTYLRNRIEALVSSPPPMREPLTMMGDEVEPPDKETEDNFSLVK